MTHGRVERSCPYYASRALVPDADIVFCPYNYLLDPTVRSTLGIDFENAVIILDEAHNTMEACMQAASSISSLSVLELVCNELEDLQGEQQHSVTVLHEFTSSLLHCLRERFDELEAANVREDTTKGPALAAMLRSCGIVDQVDADGMAQRNSTSGWDQLKAALRDLCSADTAMEGSASAVRLSSQAQRMLTSLFCTIGFVVMDDYKHVDSFNMILSVSNPKVCSPSPVRI
jgi:Rad3-related DNA helicase